MSDEPQGLAASLARLQHMPRSVEADPEEERRLREVTEGWNRRVPHRFQFALITDVDDEAAVEIIEWWETRRSGNLILLGPVGSGKTHAGVGALRLAYESGRTIAFAPIVEALDWLRPGGPPDVATRLGSVGVLLLDDLGAERPTDWTAERLYGIVNRRWLNELPTIVTSNLEPAELERTLDARLFSRLVHDATAVHVGGADRRRT